MTTEQIVEESNAKIINYINKHTKETSTKNKSLTLLFKQTEKTTNAINNHPATNSAVELINKLLIMRLSVTDKYLQENKIKSALNNYLTSTTRYLSEISKL